MRWPQPGTIFAGTFRVVARIGRGSTAVVYEVASDAIPKRLVLKLLVGDPADDPRAARRLEREAAAGIAVTGPHVLRTYATGVDEATGLPWLVMDHAPGRDLGAIVAEHGPLAAPAFVRFVTELCAAVGAVHDAGIVHRDLKPEHVVVTNPDADGAAWELVILDFGIAKHLESGSAYITQSGLGTPMWSAPEQARAGYVPHPAGDVWAIGLVAFFALVGKPYWRYAGERGALFELVKEIVDEPIVSASVRARDLGFEGPIPPWFDGWFARCVAREAGARFPDARAAGADLPPTAAGRAP